MGKHNIVIASRCRRPIRRVPGRRCCWCGASTSDRYRRTRWTDHGLVPARLPMGRHSGGRAPAARTLVARIERRPDRSVGRLGVDQSWLYRRRLPFAGRACCGTAVLRAGAALTGTPGQSSFSRQRLDAAPTTCSHLPHSGQTASVTVEAPGPSVLFDPRAMCGSRCCHSASSRICSSDNTRPAGISGKCSTSPPKLRGRRDAERREPATPPGRRRAGPGRSRAGPAS